MKSTLTIVLLVITFGLAACKQAAAPASLATPQTLVASSTPEAEGQAAQAELKTAMGNLLIVSARWVDEVNGVKPEAGEKILLVILSRPGPEALDPGSFSLEEFDKMVHNTSNGEIYILGSDGSRTISTMGGWVEKEFAMGFKLPETAKALKLVWPGNPAIDIIPE